MKKRKKNVVRFFSVVFGVILLVFIVSNLIDFDTETSEQYFSTHHALGYTSFDVYGVVEEKFLDENAHNNPTIIVKDTSGQRYSFYFQTNDTDFYNSIDKGDSLMSKRKSLSVKVWDSIESKNYNLID